MNATHGANLRLGLGTPSDDDDVWVGDEVGLAASGQPRMRDHAPVCLDYEERRVSRRRKPSGGGAARRRSGRHSRIRDSARPARGGHAAACIGAASSPQSILTPRRRAWACRRGAIRGCQLQVLRFPGVPRLPSIAVAAGSRYSTSSPATRSAAASAGGRSTSRSRPCPRHPTRGPARRTPASRSTRPASGAPPQ